MLYSYAAQSCGTLQPPENGEIAFFTNERNAGSVVSYRCNFGYQLAGLTSSFRTCLLNGSWSQRDPTCQGGLPLKILEDYSES